MLQGKYEKILEQFSLYYPSFYKQVIDWWPSGRRFITVKLNDGDVLEYNPFDNSIKRIQERSYIEDEKTLTKTFAYNLHKFILASSMTQTEIAKKLGITNAMLSRYIHGESIPSLTKTYKIANVLGLRLTDLLDESYSNNIEE